MIQLQEEIWHYLSKLKRFMPVLLPFVLTVSFAVIYWREMKMYAYKPTYSRIFVAALFNISLKLETAQEFTSRRTALWCSCKIEFTVLPVI